MMRAFFCPPSVLTRWPVDEMEFVWIDRAGNNDKYSHYVYTLTESL